MKVTHWIISTIAILIAAYILPGATITILGAFILSVVLGIINLFIKPVISLLMLPITIVTLGLFSLVINAFLIILAAKIVPGFHIDGFITALLFSILLSLINTLFSVDKYHK